ncbi:Protein kinase-like domain-containing protein, partial [Cynara cardunculus var. scolymus]
MDNLSFSSSVCIRKLERHEGTFPKIKRFHRFQVEMHQTGSPMKHGINGQPVKLGTNGQPVKLGANGKPVNVDSNGKPIKLGKDRRAIAMVPTSEMMKKMPSSEKRPRTVNVFSRIVNRASRAKRETIPGLVNSREVREPTGFLPSEELKVLPSDESFSWANENYNSVQRTIDVWSFVLSLCVRVLFDDSKWSYPGGFTEGKQISRRRKTASWLREHVLQLGPTFIKIGQLSSTRLDLFPREIVDELAKLQDRVPAFSPTKSKGFIERELGSPVHVLFKEFEDQPIAAASLGQVHQAILHNGEKVVVKVQRPGLKKLFDIDLRNLKLIAEYFQSSENLGSPTRDWIGIYEECAKILYEEIDYVNEAKNAERFSREFRNIKWVRVPQVFWDYTANKVLTLEYVPGIKINELDAIDERGYNRSQISSNAMEAYLIQILKTGFFHADPHSGNLAIDVDGSLIYYDFGMMGEIESLTRARMMDLYYAVYEKDVEEVMNSLISLGVLQPTGDMSSVCNIYLHRHIITENVTTYLQDLFAVATDQPFRFPSTFTFVIRAFSTLEGICYALDPKFSFVKIAAPYAQELLDLKQQQRTGTELIQEIRKQADNVKTYLPKFLLTGITNFQARSHTMSMPYRVRHIEEFVEQLETGDLQLRVRVLE